MDELLDIVDSTDVVVGTALKSVAQARNLRRRIVHVLLFNSSGDLALQLRGPACKFLPGYWCTSIGGHVMSGETYVAAALRESLEELRITPDLIFVGKKLFVSEQSGLELFISVFKSNCFGEFKLEEGKVVAVEYFSIQKIKEMINKGEKFHPELVFILKNFF